MSRKVFPDYRLIKKMRTDLARDQDWVALAADISLRTYQRVEAGNGCSVETLRSIASALDCNYVSLMPKTEQIMVVEPDETFVASWWRLLGHFLVMGLGAPIYMIFIMLKFTSILLIVIIGLAYSKIIPDYGLIADLTAFHTQAVSDYIATDEVLHPHAEYALSFLLNLGEFALMLTFLLFIPFGLVCSTTERDFQLLVLNPIRSKLIAKYQVFRIWVCGKHNINISN
jgi:hypothetical protein